MSLLPKLLPLAILAPLSAPTAAQDDPAPPTRKEIEAEVDRSLRWLRAQQDLETGSYGGIDATSAALVAMAQSHRGYGVSDGPFIAKGVAFLLASQREDGAFADADADEWQVLAQTLGACAALTLVAPDEPALAAGRAFLEDDPIGPFGVPKTLERMRKQGVDPAQRATLRLSERGEDGSWDGDDGAVLETCTALFELLAYREVLRAAEEEAVPRDATPLPAFEAGSTLAPEQREATRKAMRRGEAFLLEQAVELGKWGFDGHADPGITAMVAGALLSASASPLARDGETKRATDAALDWLVSLQNEDGSIHAGQLANYVTSASVLALARGGREQDREVIARAREYLRLLQADEGEGYGSSDRFYGGVGYGGDERPDLSNLQMALEALDAAGLEAGDETFAKALRFLQRCQNRSESNDLVLADGDTTIVSGNDGGAGYAPGDSKAGFVELRDGRRIPRSYGSMTYALLKGYLFAGLPKDDPRVEAAWEWLSEHYTLDVNPGFEASTDDAAAYQGLYYYFTTMAKALDLYGAETIVDAGGREHAWRPELCARLQAMQRQDGSWVNGNAPRWYEGNPVLATSYALIALATALGA